MDTQGYKARVGTGFFIVLFVMFALFLLSRIGAETKFSAPGQLFAQPRFWPAVGVAGMVLFGLGHLAMTWRQRVPGWEAEVLTWVRAFEYLAWFMVYVTAVPVIGYLAGTLLFMVLLALRQGYRTARQLVLVAAVGLAIVLVFKTGLSVKIPGGAAYEYLPGALRNFMILNF